MKTLNEQYQLIKEGKGHKTMFLNDAKRQFPNYIRNAATFDEATTILKQKGVINENIVGITPINTIESKKESFELAFEKFLEEVKDPQIKAKEVKSKKVKSQEETEKAELKKPSKQVEEDLNKKYNQVDDKNLDNLIFDQIMMGYYAEMKDPKNVDKTMQQLKDIVLKNLSKDPIYYTKDGQFGVKGLGYTTEHPGLGTPKEAKGKYKSSGYGDLKEAFMGAHGYNPHQSSPLDVEDYLEQIEGMSRSEAIEYLGKQGLSSSQALKVISQMNTDVRDMFDQDPDVRINTADDLYERKLRKVIREIIDTELEEMINIRPPKSGGGGKRFVKETLTLSALDVNRINTEGENSLGWGKPHIILGDDGNIKISALLYKDLENQERGRSSREKESAKSPLGRVIGGMSQESKDALREIRKAVVKSIGSDKYFTSLTPLNTTTLMKTDRDTGEKREVLGNITIKNPAVSSLMESIEKDLADINKEAEHEALQNKLDKIDVLIDKRKSQLSRLDEDEDMKALTDKKKVKELEKDIKKLEVARKKVEKMLHKGKNKKKEIIDEIGDEGIDVGLESAVNQAQEMIDGGLDTQDVLVKFNPRMRDDIESRLR